MKPVKIVKYSRPQPGEAELRFLLVEDNGDRVLIQHLCDLPIPPRECVAKDEVAVVLELDGKQSPRIATRNQGPRMEMENGNTS